MSSDTTLIWCAHAWSIRHTWLQSASERVGRNASANFGCALILLAAYLGCVGGRLSRGLITAYVLVEAGICVVRGSELILLDSAGETSLDLALEFII